MRPILCVALYARGRDYHKVLGAKVKSLAAWLDAETGANSRAFVDTGPVLERAWAERAGLGWIGKNANLLTRDKGSWLLLGEILTTAALDPDDGPHAEFCGSCTACLDACPTGAIESAGVVDAHRCISYWTIEHRGEIPDEMGERLSGWLFGCDICQEVCPWNRDVTPTTRAELSTPPERRALDLRRILEAPEEELREALRSTPLLRPGVEGLRRNARRMPTAEAHPPSAAPENRPPTPL